MYYMLETYELAMKLCGLDPEDEEQFEKSDRVDEILYEKYGIEDTNGLDRLIKDLAKMIDIGKSPFTTAVYKGFGDSSVWFYKILAKKETMKKKRNMIATELKKLAENATTFEDVMREIELAAKRGEVTLDYKFLSQQVIMKLMGYSYSIAEVTDPKSNHERTLISWK